MMAIEPDAKICVGVVGAGFGAAVHVPAFRADPHCEVAAICASTLEKARGVADRLHIPKAFDRWQDLVADPAIQAVSVAVPPTLQPEVVLAALKLKKPVFCEKPAALDVETARQMADLARQAEVSTLVDFEFLEEPAWVVAARWIAKGRLGPLRHVIVNWQVETYANRAGLASWKTAPEGGTLNLFVSHTFYYLEHLAAPIRRLCARLHTPPDLAGAGDVNVALTAELAGGMLAVVAVGSASPHGSGHRLEFYGDEGTLVLENATHDYIRGFEARAGRRGDKALAPLEPVCDSSKDIWPEDGRIFPVSRLAARFLNAVRTRSNCLPDLGDGLRVQLLMDAARRSNQSGAWVEIPINA